MKEDAGTGGGFCPVNEISSVAGRPAAIEFASTGFCTGVGFFGDSP